MNKPKTSMNFINPYVEVYLNHPNESQDNLMPFYREILWLFCKNLDNRLRMFQNRVNIEIHDDNKVPRNFKFGGIYAYKTQMDIEKFKQLSEFGKRRFILDLVYEGFLSLSDEFNWDKSIVDDAYERSMLENCEFVYHSDYKLNRSKTHEGRIRIDLDCRLVTFSSEIKNLFTEEVKVTTLLLTEQDNFAWGRSIREFGWMGAGGFGLKLKKGEIWLIADPVTGDAVQHFTPKSNTLEQLSAFLAEIQE